MYLHRVKIFTDAFWFYSATKGKCPLAKGCNFMAFLLQKFRDSILMKSSLSFHEKRKRIEHKVQRSPCREYSADTLQYWDSTTDRNNHGGHL